MGIRDRITWGPTNPFSDPRLKNLDVIVQAILDGEDVKRFGVEKAGGDGYFKNHGEDLPKKPVRYYREFYLTPRTNQGRDKLRLVLGKKGEVFVTGDHYNKFRQVIEMPLRIPDVPDDAA